VRVSFRCPGRDTFTLLGGLALPRGFEAEGETASCDLGGAQLVFTLDGKGRGKTEHGRFKLRFDERAGTWSFACKGSRGDWADDGLVDADVQGLPAALPVQVRIGGFVRGGLAPVGYSVKAGRGGKAER
jgi:hypothetical protein